MVEFVISINLSVDSNYTYQCANCENQAINWCENCSSYYCETCTESIHSIRRFQSDIIVPLRNRMQLSCQDHSVEKLKYWCKKCEILVCRECLLSEHRYHTHSSLDVAATEAKMKFHETAQEIDEIKRNLSTCLETTRSIFNQQRKVARQEKQDIEQTFANLQYKLEEQKLAIIKRLEENELKTTNILNRQRVTITQHLNLTTVQELCIRKMLDSTDPIQILRLKSALYRNYYDFIEKYNKIDDGYIIKIYSVKKYEKDIEQILQMISQLGHINSTSWMIKSDNVMIKTLSLDISKVVGDIGFIIKENNYAYGYKFTLKKPLKLQSIQVHADQIEQITGFIVNDTGVIIHKATITSTNATMQWLRIPIECEIQNNYSLFVTTPLDDGSYTYKAGDNQPRLINQNCSVESKCIQSIMQINVGSKITIDNNTCSIDMVLDIEG